MSFAGVRQYLFLLLNSSIIFYDIFRVLIDSSAEILYCQYYPIFLCSSRVFNDTPGVFKYIIYTNKIYTYIRIYITYVYIYTRTHGK